MTKPKTLLFTAFEPSGDEHAAHVITQIKKQHPETVIYALGGPKMQAAGANLIEVTTEKAVMLLGIISEIRPHLARLKRLKTWLKDNPIDAFIPTDSPAANWSVCKLVRKIQPASKIIHLVMPQVWAWASWRVKRLQKWSDHVLCLLSFEPKWLDGYSVDATFVGHPLFDPPPNPQDYQNDVREFPFAQKKLALLPGSRKSEIANNWVTMFKAFIKLKEKHQDLVGLLALRNQTALDWVNENSEDLLQGKSLQDFGIQVCLDKTDAAIVWSDVVLVCSGTATLQVCAHGKPLVVIYNTSKIKWHIISPILISTKTFSLPNLISEAMGIGRVCTEFVPHFGEVAPIYCAVLNLLEGGQDYQKQIQGHQQIANEFKGKDYGNLSTQVIFDVIN